MTSEEKSAQFLDLNANQRLLEIQAEIVEIEKKRIYEDLSEKEHEEIRERIKFLVSEEKSILQVRYSKQKEIKDIETEKTLEKDQDEKEIKQMIDKENEGNEKIEGELKEIINATKVRYWYEKWWGKLIIIMLGAILVGLMGDGKIDLRMLFN